jgi:hypothetical protein
MKVMYEALHESWLDKSRGLVLGKALGEMMLFGTRREYHNTLNEVHIPEVSNISQYVIYLKFDSMITFKCFGSEEAKLRVAIKVDS